MTFGNIFAFMCARDDAFAKAVTPVPHDVIVAVQREHRVELPATYVELLTLLGEKAPGYHPFGPTQDHAFSRLVELLPPRFYPGHDYFKISRCTSYDIEPEEYYLDLTRAAGDDTPLVHLGFAGTFSRNHVHDLHLTLAEMLSRTALIDFELRRKPHHAQVYAHADSTREAFTLRDRIIAHLQRLRMQMLLPAQPHVTGLGNHGRAAKVEIEDELVAIDLAGSDKAAVQQAAEHLLNNVPRSSQLNTDPVKG